MPEAYFPSGRCTRGVIEWLKVLASLIPAPVPSQCRHHSMWHKARSRNRSATLSGWEPDPTSPLPLRSNSKSASVSQNSPKNKNPYPILRNPYYIKAGTLFVGGEIMIVTADEGRNTLKLLNISEAARHLGVDVFRLHRDIRAGRVPSPTVRLGRRMYFEKDDLIDLSTLYKEGNDQ
jgi:hypothetical protein